MPVVSSALVIGAAETQTQVWLVITLAIIGAISAIGAAWAGNAARQHTKRLDERNTEQHIGTSGKLDGVVAQQEWIVQQVGAIRQALLDHVLWEQGGHTNGVHEPGKYHTIEQHLAELERKLEEQQSSG